MFCGDVFMVCGKKGIVELKTLVQLTKHSGLDLLRV